MFVVVSYLWQYSAANAGEMALYGLIFVEYSLSVTVQIWLHNSGIYTSNCLFSLFINEILTCTGIE